MNETKLHGAFEGLLMRCLGLFLVFIACILKLVSIGIADIAVW